MYVSWLEGCKQRHREHAKQSMQSNGTESMHIQILSTKLNSIIDS
jgi:hypothetical protein